MIIYISIVLSIIVIILFVICLKYKKIEYYAKKNIPKYTISGQYKQTKCVIYCDCTDSQLLDFLANRSDYTQVITHIHIMVNLSNITTNNTNVQQFIQDPSSGLLSSTISQLQQLEYDSSNNLQILQNLGIKLILSLLPSGGYYGPRTIPNDTQSFTFQPISPQNNINNIPTYNCPTYNELNALGLQLAIDIAENFLSSNELRPVQIQYDGIDILDENYYCASDSPDCSGCCPPYGSYTAYNILQLMYNLQYICPQYNSNFTLSKGLNNDADLLPLMKVCNQVEQGLTEINLSIIDYGCSLNMNSQILDVSYNSISLNNNQILLSIDFSQVESSTYQNLMEYVQANNYGGISIWSLNCCQPIANECNNQLNIDDILSFWSGINCSSTNYFYNGICTQCIQDIDCSGTTPYCYLGNCVSCFNGSNCSDTESYCVSGNCVQCLPGYSGDHCQCAPKDIENCNCLTSTLPYSVNGTCVECISITDCSGSTPYCVSNRCLPCTNSTDCAMPPAITYIGNSTPSPCKISGKGSIPNGYGRWLYFQTANTQGVSYDNGGVITITYTNIYNNISTPAVPSIYLPSFPSISTIPNSLTKAMSDQYPIWSLSETVPSNITARIDVYVPPSIADTSFNQNTWICLTSLYPAIGYLLLPSGTPIGTKIYVNLTTCNYIFGNISFISFLNVSTEIPTILIDTDDMNQCCPGGSIPSCCGSIQPGSNYTCGLPTLSCDNTVEDPNEKIGITTNDPKLCIVYCPYNQTDFITYLSLNPQVSSIITHLHIIVNWQNLSLQSINNVQDFILNPSNGLISLMITQIQELEDQILNQLEILQNRGIKLILTIQPQGYYGFRTIPNNTYSPQITSDNIDPQFSYNCTNLSDLTSVNIQIAYNIIQSFCTSVTNNPSKPVKIQYDGIDLWDSNYYSAVGNYASYNILQFMYNIKTLGQQSNPNFSLSKILQNDTDLLSQTTICDSFSGTTISISLNIIDYGCSFNFDNIDWEVYSSSLSLSQYLLTTDLSSNCLNYNNTLTDASSYGGIGLYNLWVCQYSNSQNIICNTNVNNVTNQWSAVMCSTTGFEEFYYVDGSCVICTVDNECTIGSDIYCINNSCVLCANNYNCSLERGSPYPYCAGGKCAACPLGFIGPECQCSSDPSNCNNQGTPIWDSSNNICACSCNSGWVGPQCQCDQTGSSPSTSNICSNNGLYVWQGNNTEGSCVCICDPSATKEQYGWSGDQCQYSNKLCCNCDASCEQGESCYTSNAIGTTSCNIVPADQTCSGEYSNDINNMAHDCTDWSVVCSNYENCWAPGATGGLCDECQLSC